MSRAATDPDRILDAATRVIERCGWGGTTAQRIADEAGISRVTLHRRGLDPATILAMLAERAAERYQRAMWPILTDSASPSQRLHAALRCLCEQAEENLTLLVALDAAANAAVFHADDPGLGPDESGVATRSVFTEPLERLLRDGAEEGTIRAQTDPAAGATLLFNLVGWTYIHMRTGHRWPPERAREATIEVVLHGIAAEDAGAS